MLYVLVLLGTGGYKSFAPLLKRIGISTSPQSRQRAGHRPVDTPGNVAGGLLAEWGGEVPLETGDRAGHQSQVELRHPICVSKIYMRFYINHFSLFG